MTKKQVWILYRWVISEDDGPELQETYPIAVMEGTNPFTDMFGNTLNNNIILSLENVSFSRIFCKFAMRGFSSFIIIYRFFMMKIGSL